MQACYLVAEPKPNPNPNPDPNPGPNPGPNPDPNPDPDPDPNQAHYHTPVELFYAHGLRQSAETLRSTGFSVHQDTEDFAFIEYTARRLCCLVITPIDFASVEYTVLPLYMDMDVHVAAGRVAEGALHTRGRSIDTYIT